MIRRTISFLQFLIFAFSIGLESILKQIGSIPEKKSEQTEGCKKFQSFSQNDHIT